MGAIFEWYQSNRDSAYPFKERQADGLHRLFIDAAVYHKLERDRSSDLRIHACSVIFPAAIDLRFSDGTQLAYLLQGGAGVTFQQVDFGAYRVYEWRRSTVTGEGFTDEDTIARIVILTERLPEFPGSFNCADGTLIPSVVNPRLKRVRRLFVKRALTGEIDLVTHAKVRFEAGNNLEFVLNEAPAEEEAREPSVVTVNAAPGLGAGVVLRCDETEGIKTINKVAPDDRGDFKLEGSLCSWFERPMKNPGPPVHPHTDGTLEPDNARWPYSSPTQIGPGLILHQDCEACCACEDYINAYLAMLGLWQRAQAVAARVAQAQETYNQLCLTVKSGSGRIPRGVKVSLLMLPRPDFHLACGLLIYNNSEEAISAAQLTIEINQPRDNIDYTLRSGYLDYGGSNTFQVNPAISGGGSGTRFRASIPGLAAGAFARFTLSMRFNNELDNRASVTITGRGSASWGGGSASDLQRTRLTPPTQKD